MKQKIVENGIEYVKRGDYLHSIFSIHCSAINTQLLSRAL